MRICRVCHSKESKSNPFVKNKEYLCKKCQSDYDKRREKGYYKNRRKKLNRKYYLKHAKEQYAQKQLWRREFKLKDPEGYKKYNTAKSRKNREKKKAENFELFRKKQNLYCRRSNKKYRSKRIKYYKNLYHSNIKFRIGKLLRGRIRTALKNVGTKIIKEMFPLIERSNHIYDRIFSSSNCFLFIYRRFFTLFSLIDRRTTYICKVC